MSRALPGLGLIGFWGDGFDGWGDNMDANLRELSALCQGAVLGIITNAALLALTPADGDTYIVTDSSPANEIAVRDNSLWVSYEPIEGWRVWDQATDQFYMYNGTSWVPEADMTSVSTPYDNGTKTTGTFTIDRANGKFQKYVNNGAHTFAPPTLARSFDMWVLITNGASAGAITTSGFTFASGDAFDTTVAHKFLCHIIKTDGLWLLRRYALQ